MKKLIYFLLLIACIFISADIYSSNDRGNTGPQVPSEQTMEEIRGMSNVPVAESPELRAGPPGGGTGGGGPVGGLIIDSIPFISVILIAGIYVFYRTRYDTKKMK